jgi:hypothetical protein
MTPDILTQLSQWIGRDYIDGTTRRLLQTAMEEIESLQRRLDHKQSIAERVFDGHWALSELGDHLDDAGVQYENMGHDHYDCSLELHDVPDDFRLNGTQQNIIRDAGFACVYVNHKNKWETHYGWRKGDFPVSGWRVSYPHKRGENGGPILVEADIPSWRARGWFDTGYAVIKEKP